MSRANETAPRRAGAAGRDTAARSRGPSLLARRPDVLPVAAAVAAWVALAGSSTPTAWTDLTGALSAGHLGHGSVFSASGLAMVAVMTVAMMAPLSIAGVRTVAATSLWWRAGRAVTWYFVTFIAAWTVIAICLAPIATALAGLFGSPDTAAGILVLACAIAQFDPHRADLTKSCDRPMRLRANGSDANVDCARFGLLTAARGVRLCALPMLAMLAVPASLVVMAVLTALSVADRVTQGARRRHLAILYVTLAAVLVI